MSPFPFRAFSSPVAPFRSTSRGPVEVPVCGNVGRATATIAPSALFCLAAARSRRDDGSGRRPAGNQDAPGALGKDFDLNLAIQVVRLGVFDSRSDGLNLTITDGIFNLNFLFLGGPAPPAPGTATCGPDPGADDLAPCAYTHC